MQILYVVSFLLIIFTTAYSIVKDSTEPATPMAEAWAVHMGAWHKAAAIYCQDTPCAGGVVSALAIRNNLPEIVASAPSFNSNRFTTNYDLGSKYLVTYMNSGRPPVTKSTLSGAYGELFQGKHTIHFGIWDSAANLIYFPSGAHDLKSMTPPSNAMLGVPDRSPVIITRL